MEILLENGARPKQKNDEENLGVAIINVILSAVSAYGSCCCEYCTIEVEHGPTCVCTGEMKQNQQLWIRVVELMLSAGTRFSFLALVLSCRLSNLKSNLPTL